jgi:5-methyltetrahydrofolate--homocysteine methyltransferase
MTRSTARVRQLDELLARRILVLDGAMGTMVQGVGLDEAAVRGARFAAHTHDLARDIDVLVLTRPDVIAAVHRAYLAAGSDIIETCTFNSNAVSQAVYGLEDLCYELNLEGARLAREAADEYTAHDPSVPRFVAGAIGPATRLIPMPSQAGSRTCAPPTVDDVRAAYTTQVRGLVDGGCDLLLFETIVYIGNLQAGLAATEAVFDDTGVRLPVMLSVTVTERGDRLLSGQTLDTFWASVRDARPFSVGVNCAFGARHVRSAMDMLARHADCYLTCAPSAGLPAAAGEYGETPADTAAAHRELAEAGLVHIAGGCCGTTPAHIRAVAEAVRALPVRRAGTDTRGSRA